MTLAPRSTAREGARRWAFPSLHVAPLLVSMAMLSACSRAPLPRIGGAPAAPVSPSEPWRAPRGVVPAEPPVPDAIGDLPPDVAPRRDALVLPDIVDLALRNNPQTQLSWAQARAGAATYGAASAAYLPTVDASVNAVYSQTT
ncbi:MAG: TolC family protein, partial [Gemmatimonadaceae bacterium]|nr:TolC family protein [Gemmatimonadaceae bacterium]